MTLIKIRDPGDYGFTPTAISGTNLPASEVTQLSDEIEQAQLLAEVVRTATQQVRAAGAESFEPGQLEVALAAAGVVPAVRDKLFLEVMGQPYTRSAMSLREWSAALDRLEGWTGATASRLPPSVSGATQYSNGTWWVNGQAFGVAELFTLNRINTLSELDTLTATSLNTIAANNQTSKGLTALMKVLFEKFSKTDWDYYDYTQGDPASKTPKTAGQTPDENLPNRPNEYITAQWVDAAGQYVQSTESLARNRWVAVKDSQGAWIRNELKVDQVEKVEVPITFQALLGYADRYVGPNSQVRRMYESSLRWLADPYAGLTKGEFRNMIDEVQSIIAGLSADNQVAQLRNETIFNSRSSVLEGLGSLLKGQSTLRSTVGRNL